MAELPFLPIATDAYMADCDHLTDAEHGRYFLLLMALWRAPGQRLPNDDEWLARKFRRSVDAVKAELRPLISEFCETDGNWLWQKRLSKEFKRAAKSVKQRSEAAKARWNKRKKESGRNANTPSGRNAPTPTPTPTLEDKKDSLSGAAPRAQPMPPDWEPSAEDIAYAQAHRPDIQPARLKLETEGFRQNAIANGRTFLPGRSIGAAWRGWILKTRIGATPNGSGSSNPPKRVAAIGVAAAFASAISRVGDSGPGGEGSDE